MPTSGKIQRDLIVIGGSAGALPVLLEMAEQLPVDFPPVLIVTHIGAHKSVLPDLMNRRGASRAAHVTGGERIEHGRIYVAPPDHHMTVEDDILLLDRGAKENHARPAIDPLFRSAALSYRQRTIGVILSGYQNDGTAGLHFVKACGGVAVVQDPSDAFAPDMPESAMRHVAVDRHVKGSDLVDALKELIHMPVRNSPSVPSQLELEHRLFRTKRTSFEELDALGVPARLSCPECGGALWQLKDSGPARFRCHTGHAYSAEVLARSQIDRAEESLSQALRGFKERLELLRLTMALHGEEHAEIDTWRRDEQDLCMKIEGVKALLYA